MIDQNPDLTKLQPTPEQLQEADKEATIVVLIKGTKKQGGDFYAYVAIPPSKFQAFKEAEAKGNYVVDNYGEILVSGDTKDPPPEVVEEMREKFGCDPNFEKDFAASFKQEYARLKSEQKDQALLEKIKSFKEKKDQE